MPDSTTTFAVGALLLLVAVALCQGKRVVVIPLPFTSHTNYHTNVARELVKRGHEVWLTMPDYLVAKGVLDTTSSTVIEYTLGRNVEEETMQSVRDRYLNGESEETDKLFTLSKQYGDTVLRNETFFEEIRSLRPDFIVLDNVLSKMLSVIPYRLGVPFAFVGSSYDPISQRVPFFPSTSPIQLFPYSDHMTFWQRTQTVLFFFLELFHSSDVYPDAVSLYAPEMPYMPIDMLVARAEIWLVEVDHILDYPRPSLPNVKLIGGTATGPPKPLPARFQSFMDGAAEGVVIVSFGSYVLNVPKSISDTILQALLQLPMKSVFRSSLSSPDPSKILTSTWLPQNDLLGHRNTRVFVSHCGKNGQYEALFHAVPVVAVPMFSDQHYNAERFRVKGFSETVDVRTTTTDELKDTILKVATDARYKGAISKASELFRVEFGVPREVAAFWLDHVMKYGGSHMRSVGHDLRFYQVLGLDVMVFVLATMTAVVTVVVCCCRFTCRLLLQRKQKRE